MDLFTTWSQSIQQFLISAFDFLPNVPTVSINSFITNEVRTGISWLAFFVPLHTLITIFLGWIAMISGMTAYNMIMNTIKFIRGW